MCGYRFLKGRQKKSLGTCTNQSTILVLELSKALTSPYFYINMIQEISLIGIQMLNKGTILFQHNNKLIAESISCHLEYMQKGSVLGIIPKPTKQLNYSNKLGEFKVYRSTICTLIKAHFNLSPEQKRQFN
ncbi:hypothetical protein PHYBLDRAFT_162308 [Phycomyces blakesleeanus NRRL 1555(-)]|uniref:Uncharacterized protein n=1 Tax=Phycomyces blakesleeanus (strain ATCC 8743b / DSM 1359 / FGSC 10004 / NBRC 33097 / NRRL 1555) TaxID=763407 RepID=A0A162V0R3_PHYB8|nr:hypothetical protein PHYBLDRAFT_162308 [Phycomyces blakesleeanus NRRL 1555(-)]OAD79232.1 hypothetical protein PHYBLDRAFT_162308 [Phycomyces blakesleeanus NRRL 1555(-)]|eukprot:XP_018297272.1 hypothetical protein PHYBLDRAFT_162308 [Phycomyces blakesleeanus NRRL 1555(-)]